MDISCNPLCTWVCRASTLLRSRNFALCRTSGNPDVRRYGSLTGDERGTTDAMLSKQKNIPSSGRARRSSAPDDSVFRTMHRRGRHPYERINTFANALDEEHLASVPAAEMPSVRDGAGARGLSADSRSTPHTTTAASCGRRRARSGKTNQWSSFSINSS